MKRMKLITKAIERATPAIGTTSEMKPEDIKIRAKFFTPTSSWTWYMTEYEPHTGLAFGWAINDAMPDGAELRYFSVHELRSVKGPYGVHVERDRHYGTHTLAEVMAGERTAR